MRPSAYLHGDPGRLPFTGHFRTQRLIGDACVSAAGRLQAGGDLQRAFTAARLIEHVIESTPIADGRDRHTALASIWKAIHELATESLGSPNGDDLVVLFAVSDPHGTGISGMGLGAVWGLSNEQFEPLVQGDHPLLSGPGRPENLAGVLTLDTPSDTIVGLPYDHPDSVPTPQQWQRQCGVHS